MIGDYYSLAFAVLACYVIGLTFCIVYERRSKVAAEKFREAVPTHFLFKIKEFSQLSKNSIHKCESNEFEAGGYKWKLSLYPNDGHDHISLYLAMADTASIPAGWELNVFYRLFLYDQIRDRYFIRGSDTEGKTNRFHEMKKVHGFTQFLSLAKFNDPSNGYLVDDTCAFGAEVFISRRNTECLSMDEQATTVKLKLTIQNYSNLQQEWVYSDKFNVGEHNWNYLIYPNGNGEGKNNSLSVYLNFADCEQNPSLQALVYLKLRIRDQIDDKHIETSDIFQFDASEYKVKGWTKFIGLSEMKEPGKGYLVKDTCIIDAEVKVLGIVLAMNELHTGRPIITYFDLGVID